MTTTICFKYLGLKFKNKKQIQKFTNNLNTKLSFLNEEEAQRVIDCPFLKKFNSSINIALAYQEFEDTCNELSTAFSHITHRFSDTLMLSNADLDFITEVKNAHTIYEAIAVFAYLTGTKLKMEKLDNKFKKGYDIGSRYVVKNLGL